MEHLMELVKSVISTEYSVAALEHGAVNNSDHESYAIILEEFEEHYDEVSKAADTLQKFWELVKVDECDEAKLEMLKALDYRATLAACEIIQVAAMARKAMVTIHERR